MTSGHALDVLALEAILLQFLPQTGFVRHPINKKHPVEVIHLVLDAA